MRRTTNRPRLSSLAAAAPVLGLQLASGLALAALTPSALVAASEETPTGVEQILPRGRIAAVFEPQFVSAEDAEISDDAWVLGVVVDGVAHAYSLNLLNRHEVVNDSIGDKDFAAVW